MGRLLFLLAAGCVLLGTVSRRLPAQVAADSPSPVRQIAEEVLRLRGRVQIATPDKKTFTVAKSSELPEGSFTLTRVDFGGQSRVTDETLARFGQLADLAELNLSHTRITDAGLNALDPLKGLSRLYLSETALTDQGLVQIASHQNLVSLDLSGTKITNAPLDSLKKLPKLSRLFLGRTQITAEALPVLAELSALSVLHVTGQEFPAADLGALSQLPKLEELSLTTTNEGLAKLAEFTGLKSLTVHGPGITDEGLPALAKLSNLEQLRLSQTGISERGAKRLKDSLKTCRVVAHPVSRHSAFLMSIAPGQQPVIRWLPGEEKSVWPGLISQPAKLPGIARWQLETREPRSEIRAVDFSPNGQHIACGTAAGHIRIYDANTLALVQLIPAHPGGVNGLAYRPDGTQLASAGSDRIVRIWNAQGQEQHALKGHRNLVTALAWSPDGQALASGGWDNAVRLWKADGSNSQEWTGHEKGVMSLAFSPDGTLLASGSGDATIRVWDRTGKTLHVMQGHTSNVSCLAWSARGSRLASGSWDKTIRFWNPKTGKAGPVLEGHTYRVNGLEWHPEGNMLASAGDRTLRLWTQDGTPVRTLKTEDDHLLCLSWKHDGNELASGSRFSSLLRVNPLSGTGERAIGEAHYGGVSKLAWHPAGERIAVACRERMIRLVTKEGRAGAILSGPVVRTAEWSPDGETLASAGDATLRFWNSQGIPLGVANGHTKNILCLAWSPDGQSLATVGEDGTARLWSAEGKETQTIKLTKNAHSVVWSPDSRQIATASDIQVQIWNRDGSPGPELPDPPASLVALDWNKSSHQIVAGGWSRSLQAWNAEGARGAGQTQAQAIMDIAVHPQGQSVALGLFEGKAAVTEADGSNGKVWTPHAGPVNAVAWHPEGHTIATGGYDNTLRFWDAETLLPKRGSLLFRDGGLMTFTASGQLEHGDLPFLENAVVYLVETEAGQSKLLSPSEFEKQFQTLGENVP